MSDLVLPTRGITFSLDSDADSVPCCECGGDVPAEFEEDPDEDGCMTTAVPERTCGECGEPWCERCERASEESMCAACTAELDTTTRTESVRANQQPLPMEPERDEATEP